MKRLVAVTTAVLACAVVGPPVGATVTNADINDVYCLTNTGRIYRIPNGSNTPVLELTLPKQINPETQPPDGKLYEFAGEWLDIDPSTGEFIAGPNISLIRNYQRIPMNLRSAGAEIPNTGTVGGHGGAIDRFGGSPAQPSELLVADSNPYSPANQQGIFRIQPNGTAAIAVAVGSTIVPADANHPAGSYTATPSQQDAIEDAEQNWANGDIYVSVSHIGSLPGAVLRFNKNGALLDHYDMPGGVNPHCIVFDNRDVVPGYELIVATPESPRRIYAIDVDLPPGSPGRVVYLRDAPNGVGCTDLAITPSGKLIYPGVSDGKAYQINLTAPYSFSVLATIPGLRSVAFLSRNKLASQDTELAVGQFTPAVGPTGKPGVQVKVVDPEFSSGITRIKVTGTNLVVYDNGAAKQLPYSFNFDERREVTQFTFTAEKINLAASASIQVEAHDVKGLCGDPIIVTHSSDTGPPRTTHVDCEDLLQFSPSATFCVVQITNGCQDGGVGKFTLDTSLGTISVNCDEDVESGQTCDLRQSFDKKGKLTGKVEIALKGITTLLLPLVDWIEIETNASASKPKQATVYLYICTSPTSADPSLSDDFGDNARAAKWSFSTIQGAIYSGPSAWDCSIPVLEQNRRLEISPLACVSGDHYNGYVSAGTWDLTGGAASVEVVQTASGGSADTELALCIDSQNWYMIYVEHGDLYFEQTVCGVRTSRIVAYNAGQHRFWRIRHDTASDSILFQTSSNGQAWTTQRTVTRQLAITAMRVELSAGTFQSEVAPGKAIFDNFELQ